MRAVRATLLRLASLFRRRDDSQFDEELASHLQMHIDDNRRAGMSEIEARRVALARLGGLEQTRELYRERRGLPVIETTAQDVRFAARLIRRSPGFTAVVLATLAVGIGANTVMFSVVNTLLLRPLPYQDPARLVSVSTVNASTRAPGMTAPPDFYDYRRQNRTLSHLDAFFTRPVNLTGDSGPERVTALTVSPGFFATLGILPDAGRAFVAEDEQWGRHRIAVITSGLWHRRYAGDPAAIGRTIAVNAEPHVIVGILPPKFSFMGIDAQLFVPMAFAPGDHMNSHSNNFLRMFGRLRPGATAAQAAADLTAISDAIVAAKSVNHGTAIATTALREVMVGDARRGVLVLLGAVGFVLLITCANLANLLLARAALRQREIAVRLALGASRARLLRQFLIESLVLSVAGGALGLGLAYLAADAVNALSQRILPRAADVRVDAAVLLFTFAVSTLAGVLLGLAPAAHSIGGDVSGRLKEGARSATDGGGRYRLRALLVVAEVALSVVLLVGAGLMVKSLYQVLHVEAGFDVDRVLTMQLNLPPRKYVDRELERRFSPDAYARSVAFFRETVDGVRAVPGVVSTGVINGLPLMGEIWGKNVTFFDRPLPADVRGLSPIQYRVVAGDYFAAMGVRIREGRAFSDADGDRAPRVAIVNREMVRRYWDGVSPIGRVISVNPPLELLPKQMVEEARRSGSLPDDYAPDRFTVVGVADDTRYGGLEAAPVPLVYVPFAQGSEGTTNMFLVVRTQGDPLSVVAAIRERIARVDRDQPIAAIQTMAARQSASVAQRRLQVYVLGGFALMAGLLAAIGIYGVTSYAVSQRAREIGIRLALGAVRRDVIGLVLRQGLALVVAGVVSGLAGAFLLTGVLRTLLYQVSPTDPAVFGAIVAVLVSTAMCATYFPARRAARVDPLTALRQD